MPRIEVIPGALREVGAAAQRTGGAVTGLAGSARLLAQGDGAPSTTASALHGFGSAWSSGMANLGDGIHGLGTATDAAAGLYELTDERVMPGR
jgi:hypothetical protein